MSMGFPSPYPNINTNRLLFSNAAVRQHVQTSRGLFPHKRIIRKSEMTAKGLVVTEVQEDISGLPSTSNGILSAHSAHPVAPSAMYNKSNKNDEPGTPIRKSPIAEMLYMRWLEGLKLKWPSLSWALKSNFLTTRRADNFGLILLLYTTHGCHLVSLLIFIP